MSRLIMICILSFIVLSANSSISAYRVSNEVNLSSVKYDDDIWRYAKNSKVTLYPQTTLLLGDKRANMLQLNSGLKIARVSSLYNSHHIAIKMKWRDLNRTLLPTDKESDRYDDAFAIEIPIDYSEPTKLPYIGMGSEDRAVEVYYGSTAHKRDRAFISEGFRAIKNTLGKDKFNTTIAYDGNSSWIGVLTRPLDDSHIDLNQSTAFPLAFAIWRGDRLNRAETKLLSSWTPLVLRKGDVDNALISELSYTPKGSMKVGREIAREKCLSCHILEHNSTAMSSTIMRYIAPNLSNLGGYSTEAYIKESITDPDAVIMDGYNREAYPKFLWYSVDENGTRHSNMPPISLDANETKHLMRYLMSLKRKPSKGE